jgi:hypothetical protein
LVGHPEAKIRKQGENQAIITDGAIISLHNRSCRDSTDILGKKSPKIGSEWLNGKIKQYKGSI